jgi:hypothetical protein
LKTFFFRFLRIFVQQSFSRSINRFRLKGVQNFRIKVSHFTTKIKGLKFSLTNKNMASGEFKDILKCPRELCGQEKKFASPFFWYYAGSPNDVSPNDVSPNDVSPNDVSPNDVSPNDVSPNDFSPKSTKRLLPEWLFPEQLFPKQRFPKQPSGPLG